MAPLVFEETLLGFEISHLFLQVCSIMQVTLAKLLQCYNLQLWLLECE